MRSLLLVASVALIAGPISAQEWTAEQMEVWAFEVECAALGPADRVAQCFHPDYVGWYAGDPVPANMDDLTASHPYWPDGEFVTAKPLAISVFDDVAIVHVMMLYANTQPDGSTIMEWSRWTDVLLNDGGRWSWIADAGGEVKLFRGPQGD